MPHTRILIVDDDPGDRLVLQKLLLEEGFLADLAGNGTSALKMVRADPPDVVLTDLHMLEMDGIALCRALHELSEFVEPHLIRPATPVPPEAARGPIAPLQRRAIRSALSPASGTGQGNSSCPSKVDA